MVQQAYTNTYSRVWFQNGGPGPSKPVAYHGNWKAGSPSWDKGELTTIREPDPNAYNKFVRVGRFRGEPGDPELPLMARYTFQRSELLKAARGDCDHGIRVAMGQCEDPQDPDRGWEKALILEGAGITNWSAEDLGALSPDETAPTNEEVTFVGTDLYEVIRINFGEQAATLVTREITSVYICDREQCGACGVPSDGCQVVLALEGGISGSPGLKPTLIFTANGGTSFTEDTIDTLAANEGADVVICVGSNTIVLSEDSESIHWIDTSDMLSGAGTWAEVTTGFVATFGPLAAWSLGANATWIVGESGYIYFTTNPVNGVVVNNAGVATAQNLNDVHFFDILNGVAVGASNAVVVTADGGETWRAVTGPAVGIVLNAAWMRSPLEWFVGAANGNLYYTLDGGATWNTKSFPGSLAAGGGGSVRDIVFVTPSVGYLAHSTATPDGRILRTIDGGNSWYVAPEGPGNIPTNDYISRLAVCDEPNIVWGGGLAGNAVDGILVKGA